MEWAELLNTANLPTVLVAIAIVLLTGGVGASIVNGIVASRRGIKGDALLKEQNGIDGLSKLSTAQDVTIKRLDGQVGTLTARVDTLEQRLREEIEYSNSLITLLAMNGIKPHTRKK